MVFPEQCKRFQKIGENSIQNVRKFTKYAVCKKGMFKERLLNNMSQQGVNFTNILCAVFLYESFARNFFVLEVKVKFLLAQLRS
jgi:hypothetical protein